MKSGEDAYSSSFRGIQFCFLDFMRPLYDVHRTVLKPKLECILKEVFSVRRMLCGGYWVLRGSYRENQAFILCLSITATTFSLSTVTFRCAINE